MWNPLKPERRKIKKEELNWRRKSSLNLPQGLWFSREGKEENLFVRRGGKKKTPAKHVFLSRKKKESINEGKRQGIARGKGGTGLKRELSDVFFLGASKSQKKGLFEEGEGKTSRGNKRKS